MSDAVDAILTKYLSDGRVFALMHLACLLVVCYLMWDLLRERRGLVAWLNNSRIGLQKEGSVVRLFQEFVATVEQLAPKGESVDAGEHLQRIEDAVSRKETHLSDAVHWFLLIGIAGTLFGLFEFASNMANTASTPPEEIVVNVGTFLAAAMGKAFPVGFVGVILLIAFQFITSVAERSVDRAVGIATSRVLQLRRETTVAQTQFVDAVRNSIRDSMEPLNHLREVLELSLQPVITTFKGSLDEALELVRLQMAEMGKFVGDVPDVQQGFVKAATQVKEASDALNRFAETFSSRLGAIEAQSAGLQRNARATIEWSTKLMALSEQQQNQIDSMRVASDLTLENAAILTDRISDVIDSIHAASAAVDQIPDILKVAVVETMPGLIETAGDRLLKNWTQATRDMSRDLAGTVEASMGRVNQGLENVVGQIQYTLLEWDRVNRNVESLVHDVIERAMRSALEPNQLMIGETRALAAEVRAIVSSRESAARQLHAATAELGRVLSTIGTQMEPITQSFRESAAKVALAAKAMATAVDVVASPPVRSARAIREAPGSDSAPSVKGAG